MSLLDKPLSVAQLLVKETLEEDIRRIEDTMTVGNYFDLLPTLERKKRELFELTHAKPWSITT